MKNKFAFSALALMLILVATVAIVPPVRAQAEQLFGFVFHITAADGTPISTITNQAGEGMGFQIMQPTYQPAAFKDSLIGNGMVTSTGETADATNSGARIVNQPFPIWREVVVVVEIMVFRLIVS